MDGSWADTDVSKQAPEAHGRAKKKKKRAMSIHRDRSSTVGKITMELVATQAAPSLFFCPPKHVGGPNFPVEVETGPCGRSHGS